ncbi:MAG: hypothetical protein LBU74_02155 [Methanobacteriaceae archaeon]|jgi:hypothetical protein|nr:hypothetical protein [Candidatus Methanorudis spinitermitis]
MEIDLSAMILITAIIVANILVLVKVFDKQEKEEEEKEDHDPKKEFPEVSKFWEEPMNDNHKGFLDSDKYDLNYEIATENTDSSNEQITDINNEIINEQISDITREMHNEKDFATENKKHDITIAKTLEENEEFIRQNRKKNSKNSEVAEITIRDKVHKLTLKDTIIFTHNNENYSSYILEIKHGNVKVKYRSKEKWISFSDIKKVL